VTLGQIQSQFTVASLGKLCPPKSLQQTAGRILVAENTTQGGLIHLYPVPLLPVLPGCRLTRCLIRTLQSPPFLHRNIILQLL